VSRDLLVFDPSVGLDKEDAWGAYERVLSETQGPSKPLSATFARFNRVLLDCFPIFDSRRSESFRDLLVPRFEMMVLSTGYLFAFPYRGDDEMLLVSRIACDSGLAVFDPQSGTVMGPFPSLDASREWAPSPGGPPGPC
jgi:hypothetical protein